MSTVDESQAAKESATAFAAAAAHGPAVAAPTAPATAGRPAATAAERPLEDVLQEAPRGTLLILLLYALVIVGLWGYAYASLVLRR